MREYLSDKMWQARGMLLIARERVKEQALKLVKEENGDTNFVAIIIIIVILIAIAGIFHQQLSDAIKAVFGNLTSFINESNHAPLSGE